jgi:hypothetical protein
MPGHREPPTSQARVLVVGRAKSDHCCNGNVQSAALVLRPGIHVQHDEQAA